MPRSNPASRASFFASGDATTLDDDEGEGEEEDDGVVVVAEVVVAVDGADTDAESYKTQYSLAYINK